MLLDILPHVNAFFATISSVATLVYAVISFRTLKEIKKQRQSTYRPDLIIEDDYFYIYSFVKNGLAIPTEWLKEDKGHIYSSPDSVTRNPYFLKLHNIGLGAAKNLELNFELDMPQIFKNFDVQNKQLPENLRFEIIRDRFLLEIKPNSDSTPFTGSTYMNLEKGLRSKLNHVLPIAATSGFTGLRIPSLYQSLSELHLIKPGQFRNLRIKKKIAFHVLILSRSQL